MSEPDFDLFEFVRRSAVPESPSPDSFSADREACVPLDLPARCQIDEKAGGRSVLQQEISDSSTPTLHSDTADNVQSDESGKHGELGPIYHSRTLDSIESVGHTVPAQGREGVNPISPGVKRQRTYREIRPDPDTIRVPPLDQSAGMFYHASMSTQGKLPKEPRKRRRMDLATDTYQATREIGACVRCRMHRVKCSNADPCNPCGVNQTFHELCCRTQVKDLSIHHPGLATKFVESCKHSIRHWNTDENQKKVVKLWHGLGSSFPVTVTEYTPRQEITDLFWKEPTGWQMLVHTSYGIQSVADVDSDALDSYMWSQIPHVLDQIQAKKTDCSPSSLGPPEPPSSVSRSASKVWLHTMRTVYNYTNSHTNDNKVEILRRTLLLWTYTFLQYHGLWQFTLEKNHDKLGMSQLGLTTKNCETLTPFEGTTPLPRLLAQQIHTCIEGRMNVLEKSLVKELQNAYILTFKSQPKYDWKIVYLTTWVYLAILEEIVWDAGRWNNLRQVGYLVLVRSIVKPLRLMHAS